MKMCPYETFPALSALPVVHAFSRRIHGLDVRVERPAAMERLANSHHQLQAHLGLGKLHRITAEQVHGNGVACIEEPVSGAVPGVDALVTRNPAFCLAIHVADCGAVYFFDPVRRVIACAHSGKKGTELGIAQAVLARMIADYGCQAADIIVQLAPCIRPPNYEVDFAAQIMAQCVEVGVKQFFDCGICTASHPTLYYSYRKEGGLTGRMVALLALGSDRLILGD